ncbi:SigE family RNA polymerase sigma factor [Alloalcanivorax gelatiniphagus]
MQEVYATSYRRLVGQLTGVTGDLAEAEDAVMEAFARAVNSSRSFLAADNPEAWLRTVAVNVTRTRWRRARFFREVSHRLVAEPDRDGAYDDLPVDRLALLAALRRLPAAQREAIALHHLADLPVDEVARAVGAPVGTVKARLARGRTVLAALLTEEPTGRTTTTSTGGTTAVTTDATTGRNPS